MYYSLYCCVLFAMLQTLCVYVCERERCLNRARIINYSMYNTLSKHNNNKYKK